MKNFKKVLLGTTTVITAGLLVACSGDSDDEVVSDITTSDEPIQFWTSSSSFEERALDYAEESGLDVEVTFTPVGDIQTKLKQSINSSQTAPDVFAVSRDFVREWLENSDAVLNLSEAFPEEISVYEENTYSTFLATGSNDEGIYGITDQFPVGMMYYNRDVANELFGTDDYQSVADELSSWEDIIALNDELPDDVTMFGTFQNVAISYFSSQTEPWVNENNEFVIDSFLDEYMELSKTLFEDNMILTNEEDDTYFSGYQTGAFFLDYLPTWGYRSKVKPQVELESANASWGVTYPNIDYLRGGSYYFISEVSENKAGAWELIKGLALEEDNLVDFYSTVYDLSSLETANERLYDSGITEDVLGGQEIFQVYGEQAERLSETFGDAAPVSEYDFAIQQYLMSAATNYATGHMTKEEALEDFSNSLSGAYPQVTVVNELF